MMASPNLSYCANLMRQFDNDRFLCSLFAPVAERDALAAIGAFNIEVARIREQVREPLLGHMRLRWWADVFDGVWAGTPGRHPVALALAEAVGRFGLDKRPFDRLLQARARDLDDAAPASLTALLDYAEATSASLAEAGLRVLAAEDEETKAAGRDVAIAWALLGLLRAIPFHARTRRIYLPADMSRQTGLDPDRLFDKGLTDGLRPVVEKLVEIAVEHLRRARSRRKAVQRAALPVLLPARLADLWVDRLRSAEFNPFDGRVQAPAPWRMLHLTTARLRARF
ncbi:MAG: squalene/phytoene synthase family protein [Rhodospirillales bacterium]|nr:squalene/phytoene synthase family protein [Rhodospirillales bacterium]